MTTRPKGVVVTPPAHNHPSGAVVEGNGTRELAPIIRNALLYWDRIDYAYNPYSDWAVDAQFSVLVQEGVLTRTVPSGQEMPAIQPPADVEPGLSFLRLSRALVCSSRRGSSPS